MQRRRTPQTTPAFPLLCAAALACAPAWVSRAHAACVPANGAYSATATSSGGRFSATVSSANLVLNQATDLDIAITRVDGKPLAPTASVQLRLLMLAHGHGMTTRPVLRRIDAGHFQADGILLHMAGEWTLFVDIAEGPVTEKIETCIAA